MAVAAPGAFAGLGSRRRPGRAGRRDGIVRYPGADCRVTEAGEGHRPGHGRDGRRRSTCRSPPVYLSVLPVGRVPIGSRRQSAGGGRFGVF